MNLRELLVVVTGKAGPSPVGRCDTGDWAHQTLDKLTDVLKVAKQPPYGMHPNIVAADQVEAARTWKAP